MRKGLLSGWQIVSSLEHCVKRASMLSSSSKRLRMLSSWFSKLECLVCRQMNKDWASLMGAASSTFPWAGMNRVWQGGGGGGGGGSDEGGQEEIVEDLFLGLFRP